MQRKIPHQAFYPTGQGQSETFFVDDPLLKGRILYLMISRDHGNDRDVFLVEVSSVCTYICPLAAKTTHIQSPACEETLVDEYDSVVSADQCRLLE